MGKEKIIDAIICSYHRLKNEGSLVMVGPTTINIWKNGEFVCRLNYDEITEKSPTKSFWGYPYEWEFVTSVVCKGHIKSKDGKHTYSFFDSFDDNLPLAHKVRDFIHEQYKIYVAEENEKEELKKVEMESGLNELIDCK